MLNIVTRLSILAEMDHISRRVHRVTVAEAAQGTRHFANQFVTAVSQEASCPGDVLDMFQRKALLRLK